MNRRRIPHTSIDISELCLGTMTFGTPVARDDAIRLVHWALDHGINFFDTADIYEGYARQPGSAGGVAEEILGQALLGRRDRAIVTTKAGNAVGHGRDDSGLGKPHLRRQIRASLGRLRTDRIDVYELHRPDPQTPLEESLEAMSEAMKAGQIRHWGFSNFDASQVSQMIRICDALAFPRPVVSQPHYNWLRREAQNEHLPACRQFDIGLTPYQPLQGGLLTGRYRRGQELPVHSRAAEHASWITPLSDELFDRLEQFETEAHASGLTPARYAIRWVLDKPGITSVVVGAKNVQQLGALLVDRPLMRNRDVASPS